VNGTSKRRSFLNHIIQYRNIKFISQDPSDATELILFYSKR